MPKPQIGAGDDIFIEHNVREPLEPLHDQPWMLHMIGDRIDHAGDERFSVGQFYLFPYLENSKIVRMFAVTSRPVNDRV